MDSPQRTLTRRTPRISLLNIEGSMLFRENGSPNEEIETQCECTSRVLGYYVAVAKMYRRVVAKENILKKGECSSDAIYTYWKTSLRRMLHFFVFLTSPNYGVLANYITLNATNVSVNNTQGMMYDDFASCLRSPIMHHDGDHDGVKSPSPRFGSTRPNCPQHLQFSLPINFPLTKKVLKLLRYLSNFHYT